MGRLRVDSGNASGSQTPAREHRGKLPVLSLALLLGGCFEAPEPSWVVDDWAQMGALRFEVVERGALGAVLGPVPPGRVALEALPGDTLRFVPLILARERILAPTAVDAIYFACGWWNCIDELLHPDALMPCSPAVSLASLSTVCVLSRGAPAQWSLAADVSTFSEGGLPAVLMVVGVPGMSSTDECVERLRQRPLPNLDGCLIAQRAVVLGPAWLLDVVRREQLGEPYELDPRALTQSPNFNPEVEAFDLEILRGGASMGTRRVAIGEHLWVQPGDEVRLALATAPLDEQRYIYNPLDPEPLEFVETVVADWYTNVNVPTSLDSWEGRLSIEWQVPANVSAVRIDALIRDGAGGYALGSVEFSVTDGVR